MAPSTATPSSLHRAPVACLECRAAKVRCLLSHRPTRCDRCINNRTECVFTRPRRARLRDHPNHRRLRRDATTDDAQNTPREESTAAARLTSPSLSTTNESVSALQPPTPTTSNSDEQTASTDGQEQRVHQQQQPVITNEIRARIIATLATLKGKRGSPFSFVTSGERSSFVAGASSDEQVQLGAQSQPQPQEHAQHTPFSLKLSWLLRPLRAGPRRQPEDATRQSVTPVKMPSYISSMTLGQTLTDPIDGGMLNHQASTALFEHFMLQMNAKWEYVLDPHLDTHDSVRRRSPLLFASILFCSAKFTNYVDGNIVTATDPFLLSRLCSLARNLVIKTLAEGDRSIETMQAFYLLVCWKDPDDDISYLHSGYAFRILHDLDLDQTDDGGSQTARRRRAWLALFRQDRQQSLFFMRRPSLSLNDEECFLIGDAETWSRMPHSLPFDFVSCCSADLRRIQSNLRAMVQKASSTMLKCLLDLMDSELNRWRTRWQSHLEAKDWSRSSNDLTLSPGFLHPGKDHLEVLVGVWENSVRLNVASAILRQTLMDLMASSRCSRGQHPLTSLGLDITAIEQALSPETAGLNSSVSGAFGTLRGLNDFPPDDLRRAPDAILLLAPNAALFLCLLLCLPCNGILGPSFQQTAVTLIRDIARHIRESVRSPQDTVALAARHLDSLVDLLDHPQPQRSYEGQETNLTSCFDLPPLSLETGEPGFGDPTLQAAQVLASGIARFDENFDDSNVLHLQSISNLLDDSFFWEMMPTASDVDLV